jgi:hypothetical protein
MYLQTPKVSSVVLFGSLGLAALVLVLNIGVVLAASSAALGKVHKIFQQKFHDGVPLSAHKTFWWRAPLSLAVCFLFPLVYELVAEKGVEALLMHTLEARDPHYAAALRGAPALLVGGFLVLFTLTYGVHSMLFLFRYPVKPKTAETAAASGPQPIAPQQPIAPAHVAAPPGYTFQQPVPQLSPSSVPPPLFATQHANAFAPIVSPAPAPARPPSVPPAPLAQLRPDLAARVRDAAKAPPPVPAAPTYVPRIEPAVVAQAKPAAAVDPLAIFDRLMAGKPNAIVPLASPSTDDVATVAFERSADDTIQVPAPQMGRYAPTMLDGSRRG